MIPFLLRLLFPKTAQLADYAESLRQKDAMIQSLVDAVVRGRGESPVFGGKAVAAPGQPVRTSNPFTAEQEAWRTNSLLQENERIIAEAIEDEDAYAELYSWALDGRAGAEELLAEVDRRLAGIAALRSAKQEEQVVQ